MGLSSIGKERKQIVCEGKIYLQISALRLEPVLDEVLRIIAEAQHKVSFSLQLVDVLNRLMNLQWTQPVQFRFLLPLH